MESKRDMKALSNHHLRQRLADLETQHNVLKHQGVEHLARDESLTTASLISLACEVEENQETNPALLILQNRANEEVFAQACELLESKQRPHRIVGAQILREFPRLDLAPHHFSARIVDQLWNAVQKENKISVLTWLLNSIGWHKLKENVSKLAEFKTHPAVQVREVVASGLLLCIPSCTEHDLLFKSLLELAHDEEQDVVGCILYDVAEYPELFQTHWDSWMLIAQKWQTHPARLGQDAHTILKAQTHDSR
jgi:hypothetical protein